MQGTRSTRNAKVDPQIVAIYKDAAELVGIDGPRDEIVKWLSEGESAHRQNVVSIVGYGGLGKTTLAKQVYDKLGANFECRAFVSISRSPDMAKILNSILSQFRNEDYSHAELGDPQLTIDKIRNFLKDRRYFIIIDDIWDAESWRTLSCALFKNRCGSVIMTTTRIHDVAKSCCSSHGDLVYKIQPLSAADSKKLFFKRIFDCEEKCPLNLKEASDNILKKCGGLPLAINAISSMLATGKTKEEWDHLRLSIGFARGKNSDIDTLDYILSLSYFDLPLYLRSCLLYLTMFPEDYEIEMQRLVQRWISEGLIHGEAGRDLIELGETYFHELVNRSLIQPVDIGYDGKASRCRVHDTVLDFLIYKSTEENFCTMLSSHVKSDSRVRRLSLMENEDPGSVEQLDLSHARSLFAFGFTRKYFPSLVNLNALRMLDLHGCRRLVNHHIKDIGRLFQLRYLNISWTAINELPRQIGDLEYLETLDASFTGLVELPESVTRLKRLARLFVPAKIKLPDEIGNMNSLQELWDINPFKQSLNFLEELGKLTNLRNLRIIWDSDGSDDASYKGKELVSSLCKLDASNLRTLHIEFYLTEREATLIRHPFFPALNSIREIQLRSGKLCWISKCLLSFANLQSLHIIGDTEIKQRDLDMVGSIATLLEFKLRYCRCVGPIIIGRGFPQLQKLAFYYSYMQLTFEVGAMPNVKKLDFSIHLKSFKSAGGGFDFGIQHLSSLASIRVTISCDGARAAYVESTERSFRSMAEANPNRPTLEITRELTEDMLE
ncbi:disease resistance protein RPM1 isoform X1 [Brachypodium distachyon]|uniref:disease resistance protein RPM1 isoform X1 n=1 Tax=Brachypodium distachyon TaxID=15368 RepID=UPI00071DEC6B|nr:disease resistance protein RPM1 isoform X1 [Brachypodium distachyon]|eukprot:XP_014758688.1 disease resistance protein RPM1 isoform X1 [Brachypodium distachyon]